jgi:ketosteroid isomerase-like protein
VSDTYPEILRRYFSAVERRDLDLLDTCFTDDVTLTDDGRTYHGREQIRAWREAAGPAYEYVVEVVDWTHADESTYVVETAVASTDSGDPVELKFRFMMQGQLIRELRIAP